MEMLIETLVKIFTEVSSSAGSVLMNAGIIYGLAVGTTLLGLILGIGLGFLMFSPRMNKIRA